MIRQIGLAFMLSAAANVNAATILIDDFNDGNDDVLSHFRLIVHV